MFRKRLMAFFYAVRGGRVWFQECHSKVHLVAGICAILVSYLLHLSLIEWALIALSICFVCFAEAVNTAIEALSDFVSEKQDPLIQNAKDVAAFAVLIAAINSIVIASFVWGPKIWILFFG